MRNNPESAEKELFRLLIFGKKERFTHLEGFCYELEKRGMFEIEHQRADKMNENALNKMEGGQTTVVNQTTVDASNNSKMESVQHNMKQISHTDPTQLAVANAQ